VAITEVWAVTAKAHDDPSLYDFAITHRTDGVKRVINYFACTRAIGRRFLLILRMLN
jgi:hypothetical protein